MQIDDPTPLLLDAILDVHPTVAAWLLNSISGPNPRAPGLISPTEFVVAAFQRSSPEPAWRANDSSLISAAATATLLPWLDRFMDAGDVEVRSFSHCFGALEQERPPAPERRAPRSLTITPLGAAVRRALYRDRSALAALQSTHQVRVETHRDLFAAPEPRLTYEVTVAGPAGVASAARFGCLLAPVLTTWFNDHADVLHDVFAMDLVVPVPPPSAHDIAWAHRGD